MEDCLSLLSYRVAALTRVLEEKTGIFGVESAWLLNGFFWSKLRPNAMKLIEPFKFVHVDLNESEQKEIEDLVKIQENAGGVDKILGGKYDRTRVCNIPWKQIKYIVMNGESNIKQLKVPLNEHEQVLLKRYIDAER